MKNHLTAFGTGVLFSIGLGIGGMTQPSKIIGFLDVTGNWDPALLLVMAGAVSVFFVMHRLSVARGRPLFAGRFVIPEWKRVDGLLIGGAAISGAGWGLGGFCPGPVVTSLSTGALPVLVLCGGIAVGMALAEGINTVARKNRRLASLAVEDSSIG